MVKVSICIPTYKNVDALQRLLSSIAIQSFCDYEVIISDDSPTDAIENTVNKYSQLPIGYYRNEKPLGSPENWNNAMRLASGEYIKIMHHDDWFTSSHALEQFVNLLDKHPKAVFGFSGRYDLEKNREIPRHSNVFEIYSLHKNPDILGLGNLISTPSVTIFKNNQPVFFDKQLIWLVDIDFYIRMLKQYPDFAYTSEALVGIGSSEEQITNQCKDDNNLIQKETDYLSQKLDLKYSTLYSSYHQLKNSIIPTLKKQFKIRWK